MPTNNQFVPATIVDTTDGATVSVMYNPAEMKLEQGNTFAEIGIPGLNASPVQYVRGKTRVLSMELFFDSYESGKDVRDETNYIVRLLEKRPETQAPPVLIFAMGSFTFQCVLVDAGQRFTMFRADGIPVRSFLSITLHEYVSITTETVQGLFALSPTASAALTTGARAALQRARVHISGAGETIQTIAALVLGDPSRWREIAEANQIDDPFDLLPGTRLIIPPRPL
jgi:hypothetical protein